MLKKQINNFCDNFPFERDTEPVRCYPCNLKTVDFKDVYKKFNSIKNCEPLALYIYIPFCWHKCSYCPFFSFVPNENIINKYLDSLCGELKMLSKIYKNTSISAVWIGGGTASMIGLERINALTELVSDLFDLKDNCEFTLEGIPGDLNYKQLSWLSKNSKINRISFGVQSFNNKFLKILDRPKGANKKNDIIKSINNVKRAGLDISIDLMYRLPGQTIAEWEEDLKIAVSLGVDHLLIPSFLSISGTKINQMMENNQLPSQPNLKVDGLMYFLAKEFLESKGYIQYTNWHYAKPNKKSIYISLRWFVLQGNYISAGAGSFSCNENWLYCNVHNVKDYITLVGKGELPIHKGIYLDKKEKMARFMVLGLRGLSVKNSNFKNKFGKNIEEIFPEELAFLKKYKLIKNFKDAITLTPKGEYFSNNISKIFYTKNQKGAPQLLGDKLAKKSMIKNFDTLKNKIRQNISDFFGEDSVLEAADLLITVGTKPKYFIFTIQPKKYWEKTDFINLRLVGGKIESGEKILEAMTREVREEIGIKITKKNLFSYKNSHLIIIRNKRKIYQEKFKLTDFEKKNPQIVFALPFSELLPRQSDNEKISKIIAVGYIFSGHISFEQFKSIKFNNEVSALFMVPLDKINLLFNSKKPTLKKMLAEGSKIVGNDTEFDVKRKLWVALPKDIVDFIN
ncbi:MAG: radical SAM protein [Patescibacteria group bacterium]|nr:radical SAM protein [Patescibacteria group bacterium]